jgi:hypothetical protein
MKQEELAALHRQAEEALRKYPGVTGVGFGFKEVGGRITDRLAFRVYVKEKRPESALAPGDVLPPTFGGFPTDVLKAPEVRPLHCEDMDRHSPVISGISISNFRPNNAGLHGAGTLGFFAHINGLGGHDNVVLVSNNHVLLANGATRGATIHQPKMVETSAGIAVDLTPSPIGRIENEGLNGNHPFTYPSEPAGQYYIDAASAKLDICVSSWCDTNCGVSYKNEVRDLKLDRTADHGSATYSKIDNVGRVRQADLTPGTDYVVYKVGRRTSKTKGRVIDTTVPGLNGEQNMIEIEVTENNCNGEMKFAEQGDSGSAVINEKNEIVALLFGVDNTNPAQAFACHIAPVLDKLAVTAITVANPPVPPAGKALAHMAVAIDGIDHTAVLRQKFHASAVGREIAAQVDRYRHEVVHLVNHCRPVTVVWHRNKGPAFVRHLIENARNPSHRVPEAIDGVSRETLMANIGAALAAHGSAGLGEAVARHRDTALALAARLDSLHDLVEELDSLELRVC